MSHPEKNTIDTTIALLKAYQQGMRIEWNSRYAHSAEAWQPVDTWLFLLRLLSDQDPVRIAPDQATPVTCACGYAVDYLTRCNACSEVP